jgi:hypothetical protein
MPLHTIESGLKIEGKNSASSRCEEKHFLLCLSTLGRVATQSSTELSTAFKNLRFRKSRI